MRLMVMSSGSIAAEPPEHAVCDHMARHSNGLAAYTGHPASSRKGHIPGVVQSRGSGGPCLAMQSAAHRLGLNSGRAVSADPHATARSIKSLRFEASNDSRSRSASRLVARTLRVQHREHPVPHANENRPIASSYALYSAARQARLRVSVTRRCLRGQAPAASLNAVASMSTSSPKGKPATMTVLRAGGSLGKNSAYAWFISWKSSV